MPNVIGPTTKLSHAGCEAWPAIAELSALTGVGSAWLAANLKSKNGDILIALERAESECNQTIIRYRAEIEKQEAVLRPMREMLREAESRRENLRCRWNIWMGEHGDKLLAANDKAQRPVPGTGVERKGNDE